MDEWRPVPAKGLLDHLGPMLCKEENGAIAYALRADARHGNAVGTVHGGLLMTLADQAMGWTIRETATTMPQASVQLDVNFLAPARQGDLIEAHAMVTRQARSLAFARCELRVGATVVATAQGVWKLRPPAARS